MHGGCRRGGSLRTLAWRAAQMEGPGWLRITGSVVRLAPLGALALWGQLRPGRSLAKTGSSAVLRAQDGEKGNARSWGPPGYDPEFRPRFLACWPAWAHASAATRGRATRAWSVPGHQHRHPRRRRRSTLGPISSQTRVTSGHTAHPRSASLEEPMPSGSPRCPRVPPRFPTEPARRHSLLARCGRARAGRAPPESIFSPH